MQNKTSITSAKIRAERLSSIYIVLKIYTIRPYFNALACTKYNLQLFLFPKQIYLWQLLIFDKIFARFISPFRIVASQKSFRRPIRFVCLKLLIQGVTQYGYIYSYRLTTNNPCFWVGAETPYNVWCAVLYITPTTCVKARLKTLSRLKVVGGRVVMSHPVYKNLFLYV